MRLTSILNEHGIVRLPPIYRAEQIAALNDVLDRHFDSLSGSRSYAYIDDFDRLGILDDILSSQLLSVLFGILARPVLYHFHAYEIAGGEQISHIFADSYGGWHCDQDSFDDGKNATHVSVFVYLTDVGPSNGPFEFLPRKPDLPLRNRLPAVSVLGPAGTTFAWNRSYFHRAAPNTSELRRRLLKISIQPNRFPSGHLAKDAFRRVQEKRFGQDRHLDVLLGRYQGTAVPALAPIDPGWDPEAEVMPLNTQVHIAPATMLRARVQNSVAQIRKRLPVKQASSGTDYD